MKRIFRLKKLRSEALALEQQSERTGVVAAMSFIGAVARKFPSFETAARNLEKTGRSTEQIASVSLQAHAPRAARCAMRFSSCRGRPYLG